MDLNKAQIIGRLTRDPEARTTPAGVSVTSFGVATNFVWKDTDGNRKESVEFHNIVAWRRLGEIMAQYLRKGSKVYIEGRLQTSTWDGQDGSKRNRTEIVADNMIMLDSKGAQSETVDSPTQEKSPTPTPSESKADAPSSQASAKEEEISVEDIPF